MGYRGLSGQSAIEYLMTYGWMLLVVAVTGGAIFATVGNQSVDSTSGFTGSDVVVDDFGVTSDDDLEMELRSSTGQGSTVSAINVTDESSGNYVYKEFSENNSVDVGDSLVFDLPNISQGDSSNNLDVEIFYDTGGLSNLSVSGSISGSLSVSETTEVSEDDGGGSGDGGEGDPGGSWSEPVSSAPDCSSYPATYSGSGTEADPYIVMNSTNLQCMNETLDGHYELGQNINASGTDQWYSGKGFYPVALNSQFEGSLNGSNYEITGLYIDRPTTKRVGLISYAKSNFSEKFKIENFDLTNVNIAGSNGTAAVGGRIDRYTFLENIQVTGDVSGGYQVGGISGYSYKTRVNNSYFYGKVSGTNAVGGILGSGSFIYRSYSNGSVEGNDDVGGLVGSTSGDVRKSYSHSKVTGDRNVGGLIGSLGTYENADSSYSTGNVTGNSNVGGLVGSVSGGGAGTSYWDNQTSTQTSDAGGANPLTTSQMQGSSAETEMSDLDFNNIWKTVSNDYPDLQWQD